MNNEELDYKLFEAVKSGDLAIAKDLIQKGAGVNIANQQGRTPLWSAMCRNNKEIIGLLLENGANIDFTDRYIRAALSVAENDIKKMVIATAILRGMEKPERNRTTEELSTMWDAMLKAKALKTALNSVSIYNENDKLNPDCWEKILKYLDVESLKKVTNVATFFYKTATTHNIENPINSNANIRSPGV
ncbi:MAG: hypothetical protein RJA83_535 [Pseudomonadota bacterium]|jgi:ankyrin repeat protein